MAAAGEPQVVHGGRQLNVDPLGGGKKRLLVAQMSDEEAGLYSWIGLTLTFLQTTERVVAHVLAAIFQPGNVLTLELLETLEERARRKTLGQLLEALRGEVDLHPVFEERLWSYLKNRNVFIHHLQDDGRSISTPEGRTAITQFLSRLLADLTFIANVFLAFEAGSLDRLGVRVADGDVATELERLRETILPKAALLLDGPKATRVQARPRNPLKLGPRSTLPPRRPTSRCS